MKKIFILICLMLMVGCSSKIAVDSSIIYLMDPTKDEAYNSFVKSTVENSKDMTFIETESPEDYIKKTKDFSVDDVDLIISTDTLVQLSKDNGISVKNQKVACLSNYYDTKYLNDNIMQVTYKINNAGFLAGTAAGYYALSNGQRQVGYIVSGDLKLNSRLLAGFEDGVWQDFPECDIYVGTLTDETDISSLLDKMESNGVQLVFVSTSDGDTRVIDEIARRRESGSHLLALNYDSCPRDIGDYKKLSSNSGMEEEYEIKNCIYFRVYDDINLSLNYIKNHFNDVKTNSGITASETAFITECLNDYENINEDDLKDIIEKYKNLLNSHEIVVRSNPSNYNIESRVKNVD